MAPGHATPVDYMTRLTAILAHPDDETMGIGATLAKYSAEGVRCSIVCATTGQRGRYFDGVDRPSDDEVGRIRELELRAAAAILGVQEVRVLPWRDGEVADVDAMEGAALIAQHVRELRPDVVITFGPDGAYGHPDHIAISQLAAAAVHVAAHDRRAGKSSQGVRKLYYLANTAAQWRRYEHAFQRRLVSRVDGEERGTFPWPEWALTARVDAREYWPVVWRALQEHRTQIAIYRRLDELDDDERAALWGEQNFVRALTTVPAPARERDLLEGLTPER